MEEVAERVVIGVDPHKRSVTIEVMTADETILGAGRFDTDAAGYRSLVRYAGQWPERTWAIEGCQGIGKHVAMRLLADGEVVVDVPPKMSARARMFATGQGRKTRAAANTPRASSCSPAPEVPGCPVAVSAIPLLKQPPLTLMTVARAPFTGPAEPV